MAKESKNTIIIAAISAVSAIVIAVVTTLGTIAASGTKTNEISNQLGSLESRADKLSVPVGSIISSTLEPKLFSKLAGDEGGFGQTSSTWVPADGRDVSGSKYAKEFESTVPDLRGMFLRGLNYSEDGRVRTDGKEDPNGVGRKAGDYQEDAFRKHNHTCPVTYYGYGPQFNPNAGVKAAIEMSEELEKRYEERRKPTDKKGTADETRPKNVAVYFYIKIN